KRGPLELILLALLSDGHVLLEDYPGLAKTLIARSFAQATSLRFARIQFTPDLMPGDVTGSQIFDQRTADFVFRPGRVFANLRLADEINRAPPKAQAALVEAMQERQVTIENSTHLLEPPFLVLATQNPIEYEGTYPLPEAQLDRFLVRVSIGYPARDDEIEMLERRLARGVDEVELEPVVDAATLVELQRALEQVHVSDAIEGYVVDLVTATRESRRLAVGASPRGSIALLKLSRAKAALAGRDFVTPEDVQAVAVRPVALAAPFVLALVPAGAGREPEVSGQLSRDRERALEGDDVTATVELLSAGGVDRFELLLLLPPELQAERAPARALHLRAGEEQTVELKLHCERWGAYSVGPVLFRARDLLGVRTWEGRAGEAQWLRIYPAEETLRSLVPPLETQVFVGNQVSRARGEGIEFADLREWQPGDRVRRVNWRATALRGTLWVNEQYPERNTDVVLFLDTFAEVRAEGRSTNDRAVRAAAT